MELCTKCEALFRNDLDDKWESGDKGSFIRVECVSGDGFIKASREGCYICQRRHWLQNERRIAVDEYLDSYAILTPPTEQKPWFDLEVWSKLIGEPYIPFIDARFVI